MRKLVLVLLLTLIPTAALADHGWHGGGWGGHGWGGGWHGGWGGSFGGGFLGGVVGNVIGSVLAPPPPVYVVPQVPEVVPGSPGWYAYCGNKYHSFNPQTGTYLGFDGLYHPCV